MHFDQISRLKLHPRESVVSPINSHYANSLLFRTRGSFNFKTVKNAKQQHKRITPRNSAINQPPCFSQSATQKA